MVNKKLSFGICSTIVVCNKIHSFAAVTQYDMFAYLGWKFNVKSLHTLHHNTTYQRLWWFVDEGSKHELSSVSGEPEDLLHWDRQVQKCTMRPVDLKEGLDQDGHWRLWQKWVRQPSKNLSDQSLYVCLSWSFDMATCKLSLHTHLNTKHKIVPWGRLKHCTNFSF